MGGGVGNLRGSFLVVMGAGIGARATGSATGREGDKKEGKKKGDKMVERGEGGSGSGSSWTREERSCWESLLGTVA